MTNNRGQTTNTKSKSKLKMINKLRNNEKLLSIKVADIDIAIEMLRKYMDAQIKGVSPL